MKATNMAAPMVRRLGWFGVSTFIATGVAAILFNVANPPAVRAADKVITNEPRALRPNELGAPRVEAPVTAPPEALNAEAGGVASSSNTAGGPVGQQHILVSSFTCPDQNPGCSYENKILRYDASPVLFDSILVDEIQGPYGLAIHPIRETLLAASRDEDKVNEYEADTGAFIRTFVAPASGGLNAPQYILFKADGNLLVTSTPFSPDFSKVNGVNEYNGRTGAFVKIFINGGSISPAGPENCGNDHCIRGPVGMAVGPNGSLYIISDVNNKILQHNAVTGAYIGVFQNAKLISPAHLLIRPTGMTRQGNLLVSTKHPEPNGPGMTDSYIEFDAVSRNVVTFSPGARDFATGILEPGPMMWHIDGTLLHDDRTLVHTPQNYADRFIRRDALLGTFLNVASESSDDNTHYGTNLLLVSKNMVTSDSDGDNDVDAKDYAAFQRCFGRAPSQACKTAFDDNLTNSVGYMDFSAFRRRFAGPPRPCQTGSDCNDGNSCTTDTCVSGSCVRTPRSNGSACSDSLFCNGVETCQDGLCLGDDPCVDQAHCNENTDACLQCLTPSECNDNNPCTNDTCTSNVCGHSNNTVTCNDNNACTSNDRCSGGNCVGGPPVTCNDSNICTGNATGVDSCDPEFGCQFIHNSNMCNDTNACTTGDQCLLGSCRGGPPPVCTDNNPCTDDSCNPTTGCVFTRDDTNTCDDGNACATNDVCVNRVCVPGTPIDCNDNVPCTTDGCTNGTCTHTPNNAACNDGLFCTGTETCSVQLGGCVSTGNPCGGGFCNEATDSCGQCMTNADCNDNVACTTNTCLPNNTCSFTPNNAACSDNQFCTGTETCHATLGCQDGADPNCNDNVACTTDACNEANDTCTHTPNNAVCSDNQFCTGTETCHVTLGCQDGADPNCNDGIACTTDACNEANDTCTHAPNNAACNDGLFCTGIETCNPASGCEGGSTPTCDDGIQCTTDFCNGATDQCSSTPINSRCNDFNACTTDLCTAGVGCSNTPLNCDDGNVCTTDSCVGGSCQHPAGNQGGACNDQDSCTINDVCVSGVCEGEDCSRLDDQCSLGECVGDQCMSAPDNEGNACNDGESCTFNDSCENGECVGVDFRCNVSDCVCPNGMTCDDENQVCVP